MNNNRSRSSQAKEKCEYCGFGFANCVYCNECDKWFCNNSTILDESHIMFHLKCSHPGDSPLLSLHQKSGDEDRFIRCFSCDCSDLDQLGWFFENQEMRILCSSCLMLNGSEEEEEQWSCVHVDGSIATPLVQDANSLGVTFHPPSDLTTSHICDLECLWDRGLMYTKIGEVKAEQRKAEGELPSQFRSMDQYKGAFDEMVEDEMVNEEMCTLNKCFHGVPVDEWQESDDGKRVAVITTFLDDQAIPLSPGAILFFLKDERDGVDAKTCGWRGVVKYTTYNSAYIIMEDDDKGLFDGEGSEEKKESTKLEEEEENTVDSLQRYTLRYDWNGEQFYRMKDALEIAEHIPKKIARVLLGENQGSNDHPSLQNEEQLVSRNQPMLNESQVRATSLALLNNFTLIQGPPGTGKTTTVAALIDEMFRAHPIRGRRLKILVCAPSNIAADNIADKILEHHSTLQPKIVRVYSKAFEFLPTFVPSVSLTTLLRNKLEKKNRREFSAFEYSRLNNTHLDFGTFKKIQNLKQSIIDASDIVITSCNMAGSDFFDNCVFDITIIDEAGQCIEPECLIPLSRTGGKVVLVGDHMQLSPICNDENAKRAGLEMSLFERLIRSGVHSVRLATQYRMHPSLSSFSSRMFYSGAIQDGVTEDERIGNNLNIPFPNPDHPMLFYHVDGSDRKRGKSYVNDQEVEAVKSAVKMLKGARVARTKIGVITPYVNQKFRLINCLHGDIEISSADGFQGREKPYIIFSCVRSNPSGYLGFVSNFKRLNVAITRAKYGLIMVGDIHTLGTNPLWSHLIHHFEELGCLVEGRWGHWSSVVNPPPLINNLTRSERIIYSETKLPTLYPGLQIILG